MKNYYNNIQQLHQNFNLLPVKENDKSPAIYRWKKYQTEKIDFDLVANSRVGVICGVDNLEVIDIDNHFGDAKELFNFISDNFELENFPIINTPSGGYHIYYKCDEVVAGNQKLAQRLNSKSKYETLVETRGRGGYVVYYDDILQGDILQVPTISKEDREILLEVCRALDERPAVAEVEFVSNSTKNKHQIIHNEKPGTAYNNDTNSIHETKSLLKDAGWTEVREKNWRRPGKTKGISATFGKVGKNKFYVFSSNADPFEPEQSYSMFAVRAILQFNGDFSACAKELSKKYKITPVSVPKKKTKTEKPFLNKKWQALFDIKKEWNLKIRYNLITRIVEYKSDLQKEWSSEIELLLSDIVFEMENNHYIKSISKSKIHEMIMSNKIIEMHNPILKFYDSLPIWNGVDYIKQLCDCITISEDEDRRYFEKMFKKHLVRTLRTAIEEDYTNRMVVVLFGKQEIGKTKIWEWLIPKGLYYDEPINLNDKDSIIALSRYLTINFDDLDQLSKKEVAKLKAYISKSSVNKRLPYARTETKMTRIASFVGTTNLINILADEKNTRWIILKVDKFDWKKYTKKIDTNHIWSQVKALMLRCPEIGELNQHQKETRDFRNSSQFLEISKERDILLKYFSEDGITQKYTTTDIHMLIEKYLYPVKISFHQLARELRRIFGTPRQTTRKGVQGRYYELECDFDVQLPNFAEQLQQNETTKDGTQEGLPF